MVDCTRALLKIVDHGIYISQKNLNLLIIYIFITTKVYLHHIPSQKFFQLHVKEAQIRQNSLLLTLTENPLLSLNFPSPSPAVVQVFSFMYEHYDAIKTM